MTRPAQDPGLAPERVRLAASLAILRATREIDAMKAQRQVRAPAEEKR